MIPGYEYSNELLGEDPRGPAEEERESVYGTRNDTENGTRHDRSYESGHPNVLKSNSHRIGTGYVWAPRPLEAINEKVFELSSFLDVNPQSIFALAGAAYETGYVSVDQFFTLSEKVSNGFLTSIQIKEFQGSLGLHRDC